jgi:hypothetical protein
MRTLKLSLLILGAYIIVSSQLITYLPSDGIPPHLRDLVIGIAILIVALLLPSKGNLKKTAGEP